MGDQEAEALAVGAVPSAAPINLPNPGTDGSASWVASEPEPQPQFFQPDRPPARGVDAEIVEGVAAAYGLIAILVTPFNQRDAIVIGMKAQDMAAGWLALGKKYKEVYVWLEKLATGNALVLFAKPHMEVLGAIAANHGIIQTGAMPAVNPSQASPGPFASSPTPIMSSLSPVYSQPTAPAMPVVPQSGPPGAGAYSPEQIEQLRQTMVMQALAQQAAQRAQHQATAQFNPTDNMPRPEQNPAWLGQIIPRGE